MSSVKLILVGGFLGAGKTTLVAQAAGRLMAAHKRVGLITNDQAADLVDTEMLRGKGFDVGEVAGGCFCCRFDDLVNSAEKLIAERKPDVLIGEPVGSCTDLAATVVQPMNRFQSGKIRATPFTVVVDPERLKDMLKREPTRNPLSKKVTYIYGKQLEEADIIALNKTDTISADETKRLCTELRRLFPQATVLTFSALDGSGIDAWLEIVLKDAPAGQHIAEVDYDIYAEGEAELGWLNASVTLNADAPIDWKRFCLDLLKNFRAKLQEKKIEAAHVKLALNAHGAALVANLTSSSGQPFLLVQGTHEAPSNSARLIFNARVQTDPQILRELVETAIRSTCGSAIRAEMGTLQAFKPGRPVPVHRFKNA